MTRPAQTEWVKCPAGELTRLADRLRTRRLLRGLLAGGAAVFLVAAVTVGGWRLAASLFGRTPASGAGQSPAGSCPSPAPTQGCHDAAP